MGIRWISGVKPFESRTPYQVLQQMNYNPSFTFDDKFLGAVNVLSLVNLFNQSTNQFLSARSTPPIWWTVILFMTATKLIA
ncbi:hypothetical protein T03_13241 [Trichinella britovi]|uniref:Uncharacterized protein n=1 Tax=Trichinella britovi TaxID=45882 RepID=A0A0V1D1B8_TRIBR|nr:hypothetical protein T03_13241 [Trichinella britovi]